MHSAFNHNLNEKSYKDVKYSSTPTTGWLFPNSQTKARFQFTYNISRFQYSDIVGAIVHEFHPQSLQQPVSTLTPLSEEKREKKTTVIWAVEQTMITQLEAISSL